MKRDDEERAVLAEQTGTEAENGARPGGADPQGQGERRDVGENGVRARKASARSYAVGLAFLLLAFGTGFVVWAYLTAPGAQTQAEQRPPATVAAASAKIETWQTRLEAVGSLQPVQGVDVTPEVAGLVESIAFESGKEVQAGELLVQLNDAADRARLAALEAQLEQARTNAERDAYLVERQAGTQEQLELSRTQVETLLAQVEEQAALIERKSIEAPFAGELGVRQVSLGQYVSPGQAIVNLQTFDPVYVDFSLPERHLARLEPGLPIEIRVDTYEDRVFEGTITTISPRIEEATRNVTLQGTLPNSERLLRAGMFADVTVLLPDERQVVTLPASAISYNPYGDAVYLVRSGQPPAEPAQNNGSEGAGQSDKPGQSEGWFGIARRGAAQATTAVVERVSALFADEPPGSQAGRQEAPPPQEPLWVEQVFVTVGERRGERVAITEGLSEGDRVVTAGQLKIEDKDRVALGEAPPGEEPQPSVSGEAPRRQAAREP